MKKRFLYAIFIIPFFLSCAWHGALMSAPDSIVYSRSRFRPPEAQRTEFENGIILYFLEDHELPLVNLTAIVRMGSFYDPPGKRVLAELTGSVMRTGGTSP
jgi:predicted Zn-dependent peptidase